MKKELFIGLLAFGFAVNTTAQSTKTNDSLLSDTNFNQAYQTIVNESETYKDFKMIRLNDMELLKEAAVLDYTHQSSLLKAMQSTLDKSDLKINELTKEKQDLQMAQSSFMNHFSSAKGLMISWIAFVISAMGLLVYWFKLKNAKLEAVHSKKSLSEVEDQFDQYKRTAMEREMKVKRQLMDEINKNKDNEIVKS